MTPEEIIAQAVIPGTQIFVLGSFERRVTVYAQQVRALNLVDAMLSQDVLQAGAKVAIVGAGVAGITAAVALAKAGTGLKQLDLYDSRSEVLELQRNSARYLHPHLYDWPAAGSDDVDAGLPIMNWTAGPAGAVAECLFRQFEEARNTSLLTFHDNERVTKLIPGGGSVVRVLVPGSTDAGKIYHTVILAIGFGLEAHLTGDTDSYWLPSPLAAPILTQLPTPLLFVSGNGDGGLVDFLMAAFNATEHRAICQMIMGFDLGPAIAELEAIEQEAWADGADVDLLEAYRTRVRQHIPAAVMAQVIDRLRPNVRIQLHTNEVRLFKRTSALHNRLATFLVLEADAEIDRNAIEILTGVNFTGAVPVSGPITLGAAPTFSPYRRILRLGADSAQNLEPFDDVLAAYPGRLTAPLSATRPDSPQLNASARARFEPFGVAVAATAPAPQAKAGAAVSPGPVRIILRVEGGDIVWAGDLAPAAIEQVWTANRDLTVFAEVAAADAGRLVAAIARLGVHAPNFVLHARDAHGWRMSMSALSAARELPSPDITARWVVKDWIEPEVIPAQATVPSIELARTVQTQLDSECLRQLHVALHELLGPPGSEMGWPIEATLKQLLWEKWEGWHAVLLADGETRRRFLQLLATEQDRVDANDALLVRLGPKILRPYLTKPAIFGLTFAVCSGHALSPVAVPPGNVAAHGITAHACGVSWINGREVGPACVTAQGWTTGVVLLSQLREAFLVIQGETRFDQTPGDISRVGGLSSRDDPLVIGADDVFISALGTGKQSVQDYLQSVFKWRSDAARASLEEA